jgi:CheY-like chemotaxis protein
MIPQNFRILLADDDKADCLLFKDALEELPVSAHLTIVHNGEQVIEELTKRKKSCPMCCFWTLTCHEKTALQL